ncbi:nucleotidyltransferase domain-containing protein [Candidatus Woesearchaeota archaeon]|nr:nucleotidyltransferase domain-containing protein [Candidatus Woesearchaeota archaeon]
MGKKTDPKIIDFVKRVKKKYKIEKAIFFGSRSRKDYFKNSDYDIILVSSDFKGIFFTKRIAEMYEFWKFFPLEIEPLCYTPEEFKIKSKEHCIVSQAVKEGIEIK